MTDESARAWEATVSRHVGLRWFGAALFCAGVPVALAGFAAIATGRAHGAIVPLCLVSVLASLSSFGTNDDTALHALGELARADRLPPSRAEEWRSEVRKRPARVAEVHPHTKASLILPVFALCAVVWTGRVVLRAWGYLP